MIFSRLWITFALICDINNTIQYKVYNRARVYSSHYAYIKLFHHIHVSVLCTKNDIKLF